LQDHDTSQALQRIEIRAFGILLGELLALCPESDDEAELATRSKFIELQKRCTQAEVSARPLFSEVVQLLTF